MGNVDQLNHSVGNRNQLQVQPNDCITNFLTAFGLIAVSKDQGNSVTDPSATTTSTPNPNPNPNPIIPIVTQKSVITTEMADQLLDSAKKTLDGLKEKMRQEEQSEKVKTALYLDTVADRNSKTTVKDIDQSQRLIETKKSALSEINKKITDVSSVVVYSGDPDPKTALNQDKTNIEKELKDLELKLKLTQVKQTESGPANTNGVRALKPYFLIKDKVDELEKAISRLTSLIKIKEACQKNKTELDNEYKKYLDGLKAIETHDKQGNLEKDAQYYSNRKKEIEKYKEALKKLLQSQITTELHKNQRVLKALNKKETIEKRKKSALDNLRSQLTQLPNLTLQEKLKEIDKSKINMSVGDYLTVWRQTLNPFKTFKTIKNLRKCLHDVREAHKKMTQCDENLKLISQVIATPESLKSEIKVLEEQQGIIRTLIDQLSLPPNDGLDTSFQNAYFNLKKTTDAQ